ncbi:MFS transporter [Halobaculum roseum]|uniref:MFS transporter n=1 Tax=Halobaculum roseum TaxID=2175149 RepID=A0ABD5MMF2_9EURY|nr:MFS transporter [Halobaculum roseum]QZY03641.1 MFS transporter [Halobaculum roseum]
MDRARRWLVAWGLGYAAVGGASVLVPLYAIALDASLAFVGLIAATAALVGVPGALAWAGLAARTRRRRPFVLVALGATAVVLALVPLATTPVAVLVLNAALWFVVAAAVPVLNLIVVEGAPVDDWDGHIASLNAWQGYGWVGGLLVGTAWTLAVPGFGVDPIAGQRLLFLVLAGVAAAALLLARAWYPEPSTVSAERFRRVYARLPHANWGAGRYLRASLYGPARIFWELRALRKGSGSRRTGSRIPIPLAGFSASLRRYVLAVVVFSLGFAVFWGPVPAFLAERVDDGAVFGVYLAGNLGSAVCYGPAGRLAGRYAPRVVQAGALAGRGALFPGVALVGVVLPAAAPPALAGYALAFGLIGATWAFIAVTTAGIVSRLADESTRGAALGAQAAAAGLATAVGSALGGAVAGAAGYLATFALGAALVFVGLAGVVLDR